MPLICSDIITVKEIKGFIYILEILARNSTSEYAFVNRWIDITLCGGMLEISEFDMIFILFGHYLIYVNSHKSSPELHFILSPAR